MNNFAESGALFRARGDLIDAMKPDEFSFGGALPANDPMPIFKSKRRARPKPAHFVLRESDSAGFVPRYQLVARLAGFGLRVHKPSIGFVIQAKGQVILTPEQESFGPF